MSPFKVRVEIDKAKTRAEAARILAEIASDIFAGTSAGFSGADTGYTSHGAVYKYSTSDDPGFRESGPIEDMA